MPQQIELWHLVLLALFFFGACGATAKLVLDMVQRGLDERFKAQEAARAQDHQQISSRLHAIEANAREEANQWQRVERELLDLKAQLPLHYVRREDYVQAIGTIMAKLDSMALRFENILLKGGRQ